MTIRPFAPGDEAGVLALWEECGLVRPWNDPRRDIALKLAFQPQLFFVGETVAAAASAGGAPGGGPLAATCMAGYEGHRGWINYLAVRPDLRGRGLGRAMMSHAETALRALGCPKINLQVRRGNEAALAFYARLGFADDDLVSLGKRLDNGTR